MLPSVPFHRILGKPLLPHSPCPQVFSSSSGLMVEVLLGFSPHPLMYGGGCSVLHCIVMNKVWVQCGFMCFLFLFFRRVKEEGFWNEVTIIIPSIQKLFKKTLSDPSDIKKNIKEYYEQLYTNNLIT